MASTPLYKFLKQSGTSFYAFPGAAEDISAAYQNSNYKMYFSKFVLLNFPKRNLTPGSQSVVWDFDNTFQKSVNATPPTTYSDAIVESLRNYVANQEVVIKESRLNNTQYYYDTNALETTSEKLFFKWCKKLNVIDFEPAIQDDEYFSNLTEFRKRNLTDDAYFPEYLWKEREVTSYDAVTFYQTAEAGYSGKLEIEFSGLTNFKIGDKVRLYNVSNSTIYNNGGLNTDLQGSDSESGINLDVLYVIAPTSTDGQKIIVNVTTTLNSTTETSAQCELVYNRLVQYIGEVTGVSNVQEANRNYTEVHCQIPDHTGQTPDILFRTMVDVNYKPNLTFPILPSQYQPEIMGAEFFSSPIVSTPADYPGSYFGQFDTSDFTYETSTGDSLRRSGDYFGVSGDINNPVVDGATIDGISLDFNSSHYVKMNIRNQILTNFDQFNALNVNNQPPSDFEFNAILWYYTVEKKDVNGNQLITNNLYGISFLDNPDNNTTEEEVGIRFPVYKKLVSNGLQDGTSYAFNLNLNFNILNDNPQQTYNPEAINSMFSMNLFNQAMSRLSSLNDSFLNIIAEQNSVREQLRNLNGLLYTQTDVATLNTRINNLETLLKLYSTMQLTSSDSIAVQTIPGSPPTVSMNSIDSQFARIETYNTTDLYMADGIIPVNISVPTNKNFLVIIQNNDQLELTLPNEDKLTVILDRDLDYKQSVQFMVIGTTIGSQNKKLDIYVNTTTADGTSQTEALVLGDIDLPVFFNSTTQLPNAAYLWKDFNFQIDFDKALLFNSSNQLEIPLSGNQQLIYNSIKPGDTFYLNNFFLGTQSVFDFSGQYTVDTVVGPTNSYVYFDATSNSDLVAYATASTLPLTINSSSSSIMSNTPYFSLNKGKKITLTRISNTNGSISEKYHIQIEDIK